MVVKAHDLIEVSSLSYLQWEQENKWVLPSLERTPFVVVRRAPRLSSGHIPVGIRGEKRSEREAAFLHQNGMKRVLTPYALTGQKRWKNVNEERKKLPVFAKLDHVSLAMSKWKWGITGSAGFELATGYPALHEASDLDLIIDAPQPIHFLDAKDLLKQIDLLNIEADIQVETGKGAFLLREWIHQRAKTVLLRTENGPILVSDPWGV